MDGSSPASANGAGLLLTTPEGVEIEYAIQLEFNATNNEVEYKALIAWLNAVKETRIVHVAAYTDSKLVEEQVTGEYEAKEDWMKKYLARVSELISHFNVVKVQHILRS